MGRQSIYYLPALLILILFPIVLMVLMVTQLAYAASDDDPFAPFAALPGQSSALLNQYSCQFDDGIEQVIEAICRLPPVEGIFSEVTISFQYGWLIRQVYLKPDNLRVGDLVQRWGMPLSVNHNNGLFISMRWRGAAAYVIAPRQRQSERLNYWLRVYSITLMDEELSMPEISPTASAPAPE